MNYFTFRLYVRQGCALGMPHGAWNSATSAGILGFNTTTLPGSCSDQGRRSPGIPLQCLPTECHAESCASAWRATLLCPLACASPGVRSTPAEIIVQLNNNINAALLDPAFKARLTDLGGLPLSMTPADFGRLIADETEKWAKVIRFAGIKPE